MKREGKGLSYPFETENLAYTSARSSSADLVKGSGSVPGWVSTSLATAQEFSFIARSQLCGRRREVNRRLAQWSQKNRSKGVL